MLDKLFKNLMGRTFHARKVNYRKNFFRVIGLVFTILSLGIPPAVLMADGLSEQSHPTETTPVPTESKQQAGSNPILQDDEGRPLVNGAGQTITIEKIKKPSKKRRGNLASQGTSNPSLPGVGEFSASENPTPPPLNTVALLYDYSPEDWISFLSGLLLLFLILLLNRQRLNRATPQNNPREVSEERRAMK